MRFPFFNHLCEDMPLFPAQNVSKRHYDIWVGLIYANHCPLVGPRPCNASFEFYPLLLRLALHCLWYAGLQLNQLEEDMSLSDKSDMEFLLIVNKSYLQD